MISAFSIFHKKQYISITGFIFYKQRFVFCNYWVFHLAFRRNELKRNERTKTAASYVINLISIKWIQIDLIEWEYLGLRFKIFGKSSMIINSVFERFSILQELWVLNFTIASNPKCTQINVKLFHSNLGYIQLDFR